MNIQDKMQEIHHKYGVTEMANYKIQLFVDELIKSEKEQLRLHSVSNSALLEELRLKLISMECFADEYYNEDAKAGCKTIFDELKNWINKKRV